jgi:hypothetical protein
LKKPEQQQSCCRKGGNVDEQPPFNADVFEFSLFQIDIRPLLVLRLTVHMRQDFFLKV